MEDGWLSRLQLTLEGDEGGDARTWPRWLPRGAAATDGRMGETLLS
jgi:hypothetical protein